MYPLWVVFLLLPLYFVSLSVEDKRSEIRNVKDKKLNHTQLEEYRKYEHLKGIWTTFERHMYVLECFNNGTTKTGLLFYYNNFVTPGKIMFSYLPFALEVISCDANITNYFKILSYNASTKTHRGIISSQASREKYTSRMLETISFERCDDTTWIKSTRNTWESILGQVTTRSDLATRGELNKTAIHKKWAQFVCKESGTGNVIKTIKIDTTTQKPSVDPQKYWITYQGTMYSLECYTITSTTSEAYLSHIFTIFDSNGELKRSDIILKLKVENCQSYMLESIKVIPYKTAIGTHHGVFIDNKKCCWRYYKDFAVSQEDVQYCAQIEDNLWSITRKNYWKQITKQNQKQEIENMDKHWRSCHQVKTPGNTIEIFTINTTQLAEEKKGHLIKSWMNFQKSGKPAMYLLECYERQGKPIIVHMFSYNGRKNETTRKLIRTYILAMTVTECNSDMLDSIKVLPYINGIHSGMYIDVYKCCKKYTLKPGTETVFEDCTNYGSMNWINDMLSKWEIISVEEAERRFNINFFNDDRCTMEKPGEIIEAYPFKPDQMDNYDPSTTLMTYWVTIRGNVMYIIVCSKTKTTWGDVCFAHLSIYDGAASKNGRPILNVFLTMVVTSCKREALKSMTVMPFDKPSGTHHGMYIDNKKCCTLYSKSDSETALEFKPCTAYQKKNWNETEWNVTQAEDIFNLYATTKQNLVYLDLATTAGNWLFEKILKIINRK